MTNRIYTRSGDDGKTSLIGGKRVSKADVRVQAYGDVDELSCAIGLAKELLPESCDEIYNTLSSLQQELLDYGSFLATPLSGNESSSGREIYWQPRAMHIEALERLCDHFSTGFSRLSSFVLPGGSPSVAALHLARAVARRAERSIVALYSGQQEQQEHAEELSLNAIRYINRVSDLLFILARAVQKNEGSKEQLWLRAVGESRFTSGTY